ncbi:MAG: SDR family NAD(P)-dependent oxidoreductase [Candidatus Kapaibacteriota bacterium]
MKKILVLGGYSGIAQAVLEILAKEDTTLYLVGRSQEKLNIVQEHLQSIGNSTIFTKSLDLNNLETHKRLLEESIQQMKGLDILFVCYGILPDQKELEQNPPNVVENYYTNAISTIHFVSLATNYFEEKNNGTIAVVTSVAGDRGRKSNYFYGSAKSCLDTFLEGLRHRLFKTNVKVITIKPGVVDTPMTQNIQKKSLVAKPEKVAREIVDAINNNKEVVYTPWYWRYIMAIIKILPRSVFYRLEF